MLAALQRIGADLSACRDFCEATDLAYAAQAKRVGGYSALATYTWRFREESSAVQQRELGARAAAMVAENWELIEAEADRLLAESRRSRRKRA